MRNELRSIAVVMPEGTYVGRAVRRVSKDGVTVDITMRDAIAFREGDWVYGLMTGGPRMTIGGAVRQLRADILRDRARYECRGWVPDARQIEQGRRAGRRNFLAEVE